MGRKTQELEHKEPARCDKTERPTICTKIAAKAGIAFSALSLLLSGLTLWVLSETRDIYDRQATTMANQATIMDNQREIAGKQYAIVERQLNDSEAIQAARLIIENLSFRILQPFPNLDVQMDNCIIKNVGNSVADEIGFSFGEASAPGYDPRINPGYTTPQPDPSGFSLAQGDSRPCPLIGGEVGTGFSEKSGNDVEFISVSYVDIFKRPHITSECRVARFPNHPTFVTCPPGESLHK